MRILLLTLFCSTSLVATTHEQAAVMTQKVFGEYGVDVSPVSQIFLEDLFYLLGTTTSYQQMCACAQAAALLKKEVTEKEQVFTAASAYDKPLIKHTLSIITIQQEHFERCARLFKQEMRWYTYIFGWLKNAGDIVYCTLISLVTAKHIPTIKVLSRDLVAYAHLEQTEILTNHIRTLSLLVAHNKHEVPLVIRFWDYPRYRHRLLNGVKHFQTGVLPQGLLGDVIDAGALAEDVADAATVMAELGPKLNAEADETSELMDVGSLFDDTSLTADVDDTSLTADVEDMSNEMNALFDTPKTADVEDMSGPMRNLFEETNSWENLVSRQGSFPKVEESAQIFEKVTEKVEWLANSSEQRFALWMKKFEKKQRIKIRQDPQTVPQNSLFDTEDTRTFFQQFRQGDSEGLRELLDEEKAAEEALDAQRTGLQRAGVGIVKGSEAISRYLSPLDVSFRMSDYAVGLGSRLGTKLEALYNKLPFSSAFNQGRKVVSTVERRSVQDADEFLGKRFKEIYGENGMFGEEGRMNLIGSLLDDSADKLAAQDAEWQEALNTVEKPEWTRTLEDIQREKENAAPIIDQVIDALKHPLRTLGQGMKWVVLAPFKAGSLAWTVGSKFTVRNVYRYLMQQTWGKMLVSMIDQSEISMGSQMVISWQNAAEAKVFLALSAQRNQLTNTLKLFSATLANKREEALDKLNAQFSAAVAQISQEFTLKPTANGYVISGLLPDLFTQEQSFLTNALIGTTNKSVFLGEPLIDDQFFYTGAMIIPEQQTQSASQHFANTWYNPHRVGNWEFCSTSFVPETNNSPVTSFIQYSVQPFTTTQSPQGDPSYALQNMIFTDYIPPAVYNKNGVESHTIMIECTLLSEPLTPFIMGIMCNGARWISGVMDFHHQHRLFCVYTLPGQPAGTYNVGFAETFYLMAAQQDQAQDQLSDAGVPGGTNALWPAFQLLSPSATVTLASLYTQNLVAPIPNPLATIPALEVGTPYIFVIQTEPSQVILSLYKRDGTLIFPTPSSSPQPPSSPPATTLQVTGLNRLVYLYHNIGFMSAGCSAQFTILQPTALCYSPEQIQQIQTSLTAGTSS